MGSAIKSEDYQSFETVISEETKRVSVIRAYDFGHVEGLPQVNKVLCIPENDRQDALCTLLQELCNDILSSFGKVLGEFSNMAIIPSPRNMDARLAQDQAGRLRSRTGGRFAKISGDLYLLSGAYEAAVSILATAVEETKLHADFAWFAAAQEALQIALALNTERALTDKKEKEAISLLSFALPEKLREVAPYYLKANLSVLAFEVHRNIAALLDFANSPSEAAMALCHGWATHKQMTFTDKLYAVSVIIEKYESLNMNRKRAFFLRLLAGLLATSKEESMAFMVLVKTFPCYSIDLQTLVTGGYNSLRLSLLRRAAQLAEHHPDRRLIIEYYCALLAYSHGRLDPEDQLCIAKVLKSRIRQYSSILATYLKPMPCLLPILSGFNLEMPFFDHWKIDRSLEKLEDDPSPFIYNPLLTLTKNHRGAEVVLVQNEAFCIKLQLTNLYAFQIDIIGLCIVTDAARVDCEEISVNLPPRSRSVEVSLVCVPRNTGRLVISELLGTVFGTQMSLKPTDGKNLETEVICPQAILKLCLDQSTRLLSLFASETRPLSLNIANLGASTAHQISFEMQNYWNEEDLQPPTIDKVLFGKQIEPVIIEGNFCSTLEAGQEACINLRMNGVHGWTRCDIVVRYCSEPGSARYFKESTFSISGSVLPGPVIEEIGALPCLSLLSSSDMLGDSSSTCVAEGLDSSDDGDEQDKHFSSSFLPLRGECQADVEYCFLIFDVYNPLARSIIVKFSESVPCSRIKIMRQSRRRIVVPFARLRIPLRVLQSEIEFVGHQLSLLRKLCRSEQEVSHQSPPLSHLCQVETINKEWYWTKQHLLTNLSITWMAEPNRHGNLSVAEAIVESTAAEFIRRSEVAIKVRSESESGEWPLFRLIKVTIDVDFRDLDLNEEEYIIRALPTLYISDDELGIEIDDMIKYHGLLQAVYPLSQSHIEHSFGLFPTSACLIRLLVHVERLSDHRVFPHPTPLEIVFKD